MKQLNRLQEYPNPPRYFVARIFVPKLDNNRRNIARWDYTFGQRLFVVFKDGRRYLSDYRGLRALRAGEDAVEIFTKVLDERDRRNP